VDAHVDSLEEEFEALTQFLYLAPVGLTQLAMDGTIAMINPISAQLLMPLTRDGSLDNLFTILQDVVPELRHLTESFEKPHGIVCDSLRVQLSAGVRGVSDPKILSLTVLKLDETRLMAVLSDVSQQMKRDRLLRQNEAWFNAILTGITDYAMVRLDARGCIVAWNASIGRVTGFSQEAAVGQPYSIFYPADTTTSDRVRDRLDEAKANGWSIDDGWRIRADGTRFWGSAVIVPLLERTSPSDDSTSVDTHVEEYADDVRFCLVLRDITEQRAAADMHRLQTSCDHLTGVANRRTFYEAAELEIERYRRSPRPLSLILFDADFFKKVNDNFGHSGGDAVLRQFGALLMATFRQVDVVARLGGEEFAVLLPSADLRGATAVGERLRLAVETSEVDSDGTRIRYTVSGGIAAMDEDVSGLDELMKRADTALYAAKAAGRNRLEVWSANDPSRPVVSEG